MDRPPFWLMRQAGRYLPEYRKLRAKSNGFLHMCYSPDRAVEVSLQPLRRYAMDGVILFSDILVVPDALGQAVRFEEGVGPLLDPLQNNSDVAKLKPGNLRRHLAPVYETVERLAAEIPDNVALLGFAGAPWTVASYMVEGGSSKEFATVKKWAYGDCAGFSALIDLLVEATADHLCAQIEAGADAVQIFDSWAGILPEAEFRRWSLTPIRAVIDRVRAVHPTTPIIAFPRGAGQLYASFAVESGADALSLDTSVPLDWAASEVQSHCVVQGNLDPQFLVVGGAPMEAEVRRIVGILGKGPFIFNLGHGVVPQTPCDHVADLARLLRNL